MAEIANVVAQLEEILGAQNIPVLSGGSLDDYLCCIGQGMIQFVCARESGARERGSRNSGSYRSLTADKITIHPGSVMFRMDPAYIVAGEIVRTSRMYAMSVSPLSREILERLSPGLFAQGERNAGPDSKHPSESRLKRPRDFTNNIKIGNQVFEIQTIKGKKTVILPWEKLKALGGIPPETVYRGLKGLVSVGDRYSLLAGEKLELILLLSPSLDVEGAFDRTWPAKKNFNSGEDLAELLEHLDSLVKPALWKKGGKELGFLALHTGGEGNYWLRCSRGFHTSLNESLASLEALIDELGDNVDIERKHLVNQTYRRLSDLLEPRG
jgi:hypothetical protein